MSCVCINNNNNIVHVFIPFVYSLVSCILLEIFFIIININFKIKMPEPSSYDVDVPFRRGIFHHRNFHS